ncbi:MAG: Crp/Fnr family transcriptional regulator [Anaerolineae bacterium]
MSDTSRSKLAALLSELPYFEGLDERVCCAVAVIASRHSYDADAVVFLRGDPCPGLGILEEGTLKGVRTSPDGREQIVNVFQPGEVFGVASVFTRRPAQLTMIALEPVTIWFVQGRDLLVLMERFPALMHSVVCQLAERVCGLVDLVEDLSLRTVEMRLARRLLEEAMDGVMQRHRWATQAEIAAQLGTVTYVINRALRGLEEDGLISVSREAIIILDPEGLRERVDRRGVSRLT